MPAPPSHHDPDMTTRTTSDLALRLDPNRRRLIFGLPAGLALTTPLALLGCGGGGSGEEEADPGTGVDLHDPGRAYAGTQNAVATEVTVALPAGATVPEGQLAAHTLLGGFGVVSAGKASLPLLGGGLQLASVYTRDQLPVLLGHVDSGSPGTIDSRSTAVALVAAALGAPVFEDAVLASWLAEIASSDVVPPLAAVLEAELKRDVYALAAWSPAIAAAVDSAAAGMLAGAGVAKAGGALAGKGAPRLRGVTVNPAGERSGVEPVLGATLNSVYVRNAKLRRAYYTIRRESSTDSAGNVTRDVARTVVASGSIPMLPAFSSASSIITAVTTAAYSGADSSGDPDTSLAYSKTPEATLALAPEGAKYTTYSVTVLTAGNLAAGFDRAWAVENLTLDEIAMVDITQMSTAHLGLQQVFLDVLLPMFQTWIGGKVSSVATSTGFGTEAYDNRGKVGLAVLGELVKVLQTTLPAVYTKLSAGDPAYGPAEALVEILQKHIVTLVDVPIAGRNVTVPVLTSFSIKILLALAKWYAYEFMNVKDGAALLQFLEGHGGDEGVVKYNWKIPGKEIKFDANTVAHAGLAVAMKALSTVDGLLGHVNNARIVGDMLTSKLVESWELKVGKANVKLTPTPLKIDKIGVSYPIKAEIVDNDNDEFGVEKGSWRFDWVCTAQYGDLYKPDTGGGTRETNRFSTSNANATCDYMARTLPDASAAAETITVQAWFEPIGSSQPAVLVGQATCTLEFKQEFTLKISPQTGARLATDITMPVYGFVNETLPTGTSIEWTWTHAGVGTLTTPPTDGDTKQHAVSLATGSTAGFVTLGLSAKLTVPATATTAGRTVITAPISVSYQVDKGVRTVTFECGGGSFPCGPTCGVSDYTAFIVPKIPGALGYSGTFSGFGYGPCNRTVSWNSIKGDGGGCNFPITGHPFSAGDSASAWAVWIGFGGPIEGSGKFVATVTLPA